MIKSPSLRAVARGAKRSAHHSLIGTDHRLLTTGPSFRGIAAFTLWVVLLGVSLGAQSLICIDPGHPSEVGWGTHGRRSTEVEVAWRVAVALADRLRQEGYRVVLTKHRASEMVTNRRRAEIANSAHASLFLRLHCDAATSASSGFALFYPARQGRSAGVVGPSSYVIGASRAAAQMFYSAMVSSLAGKLPAHGIKTDLATAVGSKQGALTGSIFSGVPTVLVEMVVLTNPTDEDWILSKEGFEAMVEALDAGVRAAAKQGRSAASKAKAERPLHAVRAPLSFGAPG